MRVLVIPLMHALHMDSRMTMPALATLLASPPGVMRVMGTPDVVCIALLQQSNVSVHLIIRWTSCSNWPLSVVIPSHQFYGISIDGNAGISCCRKATQAKPLDHSATPATVCKSCLPFLRGEQLCVQGSMQKIAKQQQK